MIRIEKEKLLQDLERLVLARGPCGQEDEVRDYCRKRLTDFCEEVAVDSLGNVVGRIKGKTSEPGIKVFAHMDENCLYVKRIDPNGRLHVRPLGGIRYWRVGDGPVDIMNDDGRIIPGVLGRGCRHTVEHPAVKASNSGAAANWESAYVETRLSKEKLLAAKIHAGTRVVISQSRRGLYPFADCVGSYFLDNRGAIAVMLAAGEKAKGAGKPECDITLVCTVMEENGGGAAHTVASLPGLINIALEVIPAAAEYEIPLDDVPVIVVKDSLVLYTRTVCLGLQAAAERTGTGCRFAALDRIGSDAGLYFKSGSVAQIGMLGFPTDNTHGFEVCLPEGMANCAELLASYLQAGGQV